MATLKAVLGRWLADPSMLDIHSWASSSSNTSGGGKHAELEAYVPPPPPFQPRWHMPDKILTPMKPDLGLHGSDLHRPSFIRCGSSPSQRQNNSEHLSKSPPPIFFSLPASQRTASQTSRLGPVVEEEELRVASSLFGLPEASSLLRTTDRLQNARYGK